MTASTVHLGDVCEVVMGQSPPSSTYNICGDGLPFFQGKADFGYLYPITRVFCSQPARVAEPGDILVSVRAPVGPTNLARQKCCIGRGLSALRPSKDLNADFLLYFLRYYEPQLVKRGLGSTFEAINRDDLEGIRLPLPSVSEQKRIAQLLGRADRLGRKRRYAIELGDAFLHSVFRQLFGNRFRDGPFHRLGELVSITGGGTPSRQNPEFFRGQIPWLTSKDMRGDYIWNTEEHITEEAIQSSATKRIPAESVLVVVKSKVLMHRLPVAISKTSMCHGQDIKSIQCSGSLHHEFARFALKFHERHLLSIARGANTEGLTLPMLERLLVPKVGGEEQQEFAAIVERHEHLRANQREALRQAGHLLQSLLHRCFVADGDLEETSLRRSH